MNRSELTKKMVKCFTTCKKDLKYSDIKAMDRVLELVEEQLTNLHEDSDEFYNPDDDDYCGAV